jgi:hypothetical protein
MRILIASVINDPDTTVNRHYEKVIGQAFKKESGPLAM